MWKRILLIAIIVFCVLGLNHIGSKLESSQGIIFAEFTGEMSSEHQEVLEQYKKANRQLEQLSKYYVAQGLLEGYRTSVRDVSLFYVDEFYSEFQSVALIKGRFISEEDIKEGMNVVVLEKETAVELFSTYDCIGSEVVINRVAYTVEGVYEKGGSMLDFLSSTHQTTAYVSRSDVPVGVNHVIMLKVKDGTSTILERTIKADFDRIFGVDTTVENIDIKARKVIERCKLIYFIMLLIAMWYLFRLLFSRGKNYYGYLNAQYENRYIRQIIRSNLFSIFIWIGLVGAFGAGLYYIWEYKRPEVIISPELIPSRLIDFEEIKEKLLGFVVKLNNEKYIVSSFHSLVEYTDSAVNYIGILLVGAFWQLTRKAYRWLESRKVFFDERLSTRSGVSIEE